jgi:hypothetical protein
MSLKTMASKLNDRQRIFVREYRIDRNATRSAIKAGYSKKSAHVTGCKLLKDPKVSAELLALTEKRLEKLELTGDMVVDELALLGFVQIAPSKVGVKDKIAALGMLGKHLGIFAEDNKLNVVITDPDSALAQLLASATAKPHREALTQ